ncbi:hypothetical protein TNCV_4873451 [Trichonephila clavipes]|nr:hypothetical protein TNCV_4873451 [Trichonephila clavipes]
MNFRMALYRGTGILESTGTLPASTSATLCPGTSTCHGIHWRHTCFFRPSLDNLDKISRPVQSIIFGHFYKYWMKLLLSVRIRFSPYKS